MKKKMIMMTMTSTATTTTTTTTTDKFSHRGTEMLTNCINQHTHVYRIGEMSYVGSTGRELGMSVRVRYGICPADSACGSKKEYLVAGEQCLRQYDRAKSIYRGSLGTTVCHLSIYLRGGSASGGLRHRGLSTGAN